ncbi:aldehyde dehydrogenase (NADP(+)) [Antarcticibacterium flavum]|uniref:aldehyde dehydrogenase (NADP(+)) n=1 Tax=Antarcticibacterium flavum TaxID=2058175 RepID=UPI001FECA543|nr:aldehyde dehydrogenase (NADP(+)) [Antarcticibacterium flavum]
MITGKNYIGKELSAEGSSVFEATNPATNKKLNKFHNATEKEVDAAVEKAAAAFPEFSATSAEKRAEFLEAIGEEILNIGEELVKTYCAESGLPDGRANGERGRTVNQLKAFANYIRTENWKDEFKDEANPDREPLPKPGLLKTSVAIGPVAVFGASNFPFAFSTAGGDTASALAAGCPVVVKGHPAHPGTGELVASAVIKAAERTGMPDGVFSNMNSSGIEVGTLLVKHPKIKGVGFTGSLKGGRALYDLAAQRDEPIPVFAEMGSVNPVIIGSTALEKRGEEIAQQLAGSFTLGAGQFCTNPGIIITTGNNKGFEQALVKAAAGIDAQCMLHSGIKKAFKENKEQLLAEAGVEVLSNYKDSDDNTAGGTIVKVDAAHFLKNDKLQTEVFGPFTMLVNCNDIDQVNQVVENLHGQLTISLLAESEDFKGLKKTVQLAQHKAGRIIFNQMPTGVEVSPAMTHGGLIRLRQTADSPPLASRQ